MNALVLTALVAGLLTAPAVTLALSDPTPAAETPSPAAAEPAPSSTTDSARLRFVVKHDGIDSPALVRVEGGAVVHLIPIVLREGRQVLFDADLPLGTYTITLQQVLTTGVSSVDLTDCAEGTTEARMETVTELTSFSISVKGPTCLV